MTRGPVRHRQKPVRSEGVGYGKLLLFGEHAAVFGHPAVGMSLPLRTRVVVSSVTPSEAETKAVRDEAERGLSPPDDLVEIRDLYAEARRLMGGRPEEEYDRSFVVDSSVPIGVGFGSSAALCVAIVRATEEGFLRTPAGGRRSEAEIWRVAHELEKRYHGTPSGIDTGLGALGGARLFRRSEHPAGRHADGLPTVEPLRSPAAFLVVAALTRESSTKELVAGVRRRLEVEPARISPALERLGRIAEEAAAQLSSSEAHSSVTTKRMEDAVALGDLCEEAQILLRTIGVSSGRVEDALEVLRAAGATGAKLSGAGGGGAVFGLFDTAEAAARGKSRLSNLGETRIWVMESHDDGTILTIG